MFRLHFVPLNMTIKNMDSAKTLSRHPELHLLARLTKDLSVRRTPIITKHLRLFGEGNDNLCEKIEKLLN